jgi:cation diffusion facilitator family transporter
MCEVNFKYTENHEKKKFANKVMFVSIFLNAFLSVIIGITGFFSKSYAMMSDAVHTASDVFTTIIVIVGIRFSLKKADENHQYGHEKIEPLISSMLALFLFVVSLGIGFSGVRGILENHFEKPGNIVLFVVFLSIIIKESMYQYMRFGAKKIGSESIMADAWHQRVDAFASAGVFMGIIGSYFGVFLLDNLTAIVVCIITCKAAVKIYINSFKQLTDSSADKKTSDRLKELVQKNEKIKNIDSIKTKVLAGNVYVDIEISLNGDLSLYSANKISQQLENSIKNNFSRVKKCMIYFKPYLINS